MASPKSQFLAPLKSLVAFQKKVGPPRPLRPTRHFLERPFPELPVPGISGLPIPLGARRFAARNELVYLQDLIDCEHGTPRGLLTGKRYWVYAPMKTGTVSLYWGIHNYLSQQGDPAPAQILLHNHNHWSLRGVIGPPPAVCKIPEDRPLVRDVLLMHKRDRQPIRIITSMRDPMEMGISLLFQWYDDIASGRNSQFAVRDLDFPLLRKLLINILHVLPHQPHPLQEIDKNYYTKYRFNKADGYSHAKVLGSQILALTLEASRSWEEIVSKHFGLPGVSFPAQNTLADRSFAAFAKDFKQQLRLPESIIRPLYEKHYALGSTLSWFYSGQQVAQFRERALRKYSESTPSH